LIRDSFEFQTYTPRDPDQWLPAYERFKTIIVS